MNHHVNFSTVGRVTLARNECELCAVVRALARIGGERIQLFCVVDEHVHLVVRTSRPGLMVRDVIRAIRAVIPGVVFQSPHVKPIESRAHHVRLVEYLLRQPKKHGLSVHPALWSGSCFLDLAGLRILPGFTSEALRGELPRVTLRSLLPSVGLPSRPIRATDDGLAGVSLQRLVESASAVHALDSKIEGRSQVVVSVRALTAQAALKAGFPRRPIARILGVKVDQVTRLARRTLEPRALPALLRRLALEDYVAEGRSRG